MNQIAGVDSFNIMNNLRLVIVVAIFIGIIIVLLLNRILGPLRRVKRKSEKPYNDSSREKRHASGAEDDIYSLALKKNKKEKARKYTAESGVEIEEKSVDDPEKIETDMKDTEEDVTAKLEAELQDVRNEVTTKIEGLISKVEAVEKTVLNKIEDVIGVKIQEASNKINDNLTEVLRTQRNSITSVSSEQVDSLRKEEELIDIFPSKDTVMSEEIIEKEQTDTIAPSVKIEENIPEGESVDFDIQKLLKEEPVGISFTKESREVLEEEVEFKKEKERGLKLPSEETIAREEIDEKEIDTITPPGGIKKKVLEAAKSKDAVEKKQSTGKAVDFDIQEFLEELGNPPSEKE